MISDTLVQLQGFVQQNHLHSRTQTRKMVGLAATQKDKQAVDWFFAQFSNPPYPEFSKNFLNEDLLKIVVNSQWEYAWEKITEVLCTQKTSVSLHNLLDVAFSNPYAMQHILSAAIAALPHCPDSALQKEMATAVAYIAVKKNFPTAYHAAVKYASPDVLYKKSFHWDTLVEWAVEAGSLWLMDILVENKAPSKLIHQLLHRCAPLYSIEKVEHLYNRAKSVEGDLNTLNVDLIVSLSQRFVEPQTAALLEKLMNDTPTLNKRVHSNKTVLRWCASAIACEPNTEYQKVVDAITYLGNLVKPMQTVLDNVDWFEEFTPLLKYWSTTHTEAFIHALEDVVGTKKTTSKVAKKLLGEFGDAVDRAVVNNWNFNKCEEVSRLKLKWSLEQETAQFSGTSLKKKM